MKDINIMVFGDSIVYGESDKEKGGWVNILRLDLENDDNYYQVFNLGIPGDTTNGLVNRFENEYKARYEKEANNIIIFGIGINDTISIKDKESITIETFTSNIIELINYAKEYSNNILFIGLTHVDETKTMPVSWDKDICYINNRILKYDEKLKEICLKRKINYLEAYNLLTKEELSDGLHPNEQGYEKLYQKIKEKIIRYI